MLTTKASSRIKVYYEVTKPKIWYLLVFTAIGAALTASNLYHIPISPLTWILVTGGVIAGSAAANTLTNYNDRDIDAIMERTKERPIPSRRIYPAKKALYFGLILAAISLVCAFAINTWAGIFMAFGLADNILVYSKLLKRRSRTNIVLGGFSGGAPAMIGYVAVTTTGLWDLGLVMAGLVFVWIPMHIWSLTLHVKEDYNKVNVPMLTAVESEKTSVRVIAGTTLMMVLFSILPFFMVGTSGKHLFHEVYLYTAIVSGAIMFALSVWLLVKPSEKASWTLFKFSSPYLAILFIALMIDSAL
ncbi:Protoheme IX farnesyltransferase 2 [Nitrosotalea sinensis]|uniref:Protoheme IX farnesyltransferase n=1 Tax=Nitrosotalea sinensis TaxID=1499975 RepID=A0A2H1EFR4_9ARCH|nr:heme o synthase [Candidatus Nitrosotalea sinensis]SHO44066.1 Protoheme IX farnesyltransferase 2 [Candidatus Nitrosotalea sinensis]